MLNFGNPAQLLPCISYMSRIGKMPIRLPEGADVSLSGQTLTVTGPKGSLSCKLPREIIVEIENGIVKVLPKKKSQRTRALHGTFRAIIANNIEGVTKGWSKVLELVGTGYRAELSGKTLVLSIGYSHPVKIEAPEGVELKVEKTQVTVSGIDKELVGQVAAEIRRVRPPEPYKGKGIRYQDEVVRRKPGKAARAQGVEGF